MALAKSIHHNLSLPDVGVLRVFRLGPHARCLMALATTTAPVRVAKSILYSTFNSPDFHGRLQVPIFLLHLCSSSTVSRVSLDDVTCLCAFALGIHRHTGNTDYTFTPSVSTSAFIKPKTVADPCISYFISSFSEG